MTVNTHALVQAASQPASGANGLPGGQGQTSAKDAAAAFQTLLQGLKQDGAPIEGAGEERQQPSGQEERGHGKSEQGEAAEKTDTQLQKAASSPIAGLSFSTTNLTDALRQVSHTVFSQSPLKLDDVDGQIAASVPSGEAPVIPGTSAATVPVLTALAAQNGAASTGADQARAPLQGQNQMPHAIAIAQSPDSKADAPKTGTSALFAQFGMEPESVSDPLMNGAGRRSALPEEAAGTLKILRQETHFAPNIRLSPAQQVGDQIALALKTLSADSGELQGGFTHRAEGPVLKTLDIQLTPHALGTVKVSLRMVGDSVDVTLQTSNPQTAELLKQDRLLLDQMLRTTGFKADTITIQAADDRASLQLGASTGSTPANGQNASGANGVADGPAQNRDNEPSGQHQGRPGGQNREEAGASSETARGHKHEDDVGNRLSDGLYL